MLAAIRDASVGEGRRIRAGIPGIQGGWLYFELARVAHFEWDGAEGGSITHDGEKIDDPLNRFWFVDLEDFDESPVRAVKRHYNEGYLVGNMGRILDGFRGVEDRISDAERRRHRLLRVETDILLKAFGEIVMGVGARPRRRCTFTVQAGELSHFPAGWSVRKLGEPRAILPKLRPPMLGWQWWNCRLLTVQVKCSCRRMLMASWVI